MKLPGDLASLSDWVGLRTTLGSEQGHDSGPHPGQKMGTGHDPGLERVFEVLIQADLCPTGFSGHTAPHLGSVV